MSGPINYKSSLISKTIFVSNTKMFFVSNISKISPTIFMSPGMTLNK